LDIISLNEQSQHKWNEDHAEHRRYHYDLTPDDLVIDIGAHEGEFSREIFRRYGCRIIAIEPTGYIDGFTDGEVIKQAASDHEGRETFSGLSLYTSSFGPGGHSYPVFDLNTLLARVGPVALMKINIEGGEYKLLRHVLAGGFHRDIKNLQIQFHEILNEPFADWYREIVDALSETHHTTFYYPFCWENWTLD